MATMLPAVPKSLGRLSEVFESCLLSIQSLPNPLRISPSKSACVVLVDGLGVGNISAASAHARFLSQQLESSVPIFSGFPTTTASSITSLATGLESGQHGFLGYRVYDRAKSRAINFLNDLGDDLNPLEYQPAITISERAGSIGVSCYVVGSATYATSGFTKATMRGAKYISAEKLSDRFRLATELLAKPGNLVYLYIPELDQAAHRFGTNSLNWINLLEDVDSEVKSFSEKLPSKTTAVVTADHGIVDVSKSQHIYLDEYEEHFSDLLMVGGDPRVAFLYWPEGTDVSARKIAIASLFEGKLAVVTPAELEKAGWFSEIGPHSKNWIPDLVLVCLHSSAIYHRGFAKAKSLEMIGQHGSWSRMEREVPFIVLRG